MKPTYYDCEICGAMHDARWNGDCRENGARFNTEDLDAKHGPYGYEVIAMEDVDAFQIANGVPEIGPQNFAGKTY